MKIFLSYGIYESGTITWIEPPEAFGTVVIKPESEVKRESGTDLRDIPFTHLHSARDSWEIVVSADELVDTAKRNWLKEFFYADAWRYGTSDFYYGYGMGYGYVDVFLDNNGVLPVNYLEENINLPEMIFKLKQKVPI